MIRFVIDACLPSSGRKAIAIGVIWLCLTVAFELFMGFLLLKRPLAQVLGDYNLLAGRVWLLFLIWLAIVSWLFHSLKKA